MHLHARAADFAGASPAPIYAPIEQFETQDPGEERQPWLVSCEHSSPSPATDSGLQAQVIRVLERYL